MDKKGEDILLIDISEVSSFADYFVICSGTSERMLGALAKAVKDQVREQFKLRTKVEGVARDGWLLADIGDVVVHLFSPEQRVFYDLEELWADGRVLVRLQ